MKSGPQAADRRELRPIALSDTHLPQALSLSEALSWPYRLEDWQAALKLGHGVAVEADGRLCATALWWPWGSAFATCGMIIVNAASQGRGIGSLLVAELLRQVQGRAVILRSTQAGLSLYERFGFVPFGHVHQHQAVLAAKPPGLTADGIRGMRPDDMAAICQLDSRGSGMNRTQLLEALCAEGTAMVMERSGRVSGYACARRWGRGVVIGPVIAADPADAKALIAELAARHLGNFIRIDVTEESGLSPWLAGLGLPCVDRVTSMVRGTLPAQSADATLFALSSQSLG